MVVSFSSFVAFCSFTCAFIVVVSFVFVLPCTFALVVDSSFSFSLPFSFDVVDTFFLLLSYEGNVACRRIGNDGRAVAVLYYLLFDSK